jgi:hypothetical protein
LKSQLFTFQTMDEVVEWLNVQDKSYFPADPDLFEEASTSVNLRTVVSNSGETVVIPSGEVIRSDRMITIPNGLTCQVLFHEATFLGIQYFHEDGTPLMPGEVIFLANGTEICQLSIEMPSS